MPSDKEKIFHLPPYSVERVYTSASETVDWGLRMAGIPELWKKASGENVRVAVLDSGVDSGHPDLAGAIQEVQDFTGSYTSTADIVGHGTHVAGIIAARQNNFGVIGVAPKAKLLIGKVLGDSGSGSSEAIINGIKWAIIRKAHIISMSLGSNFPMSSVETAIKQAVANGIFVICAAGNNGPNLNTVNYPAAYPDTVAVGSIQANKNISNFSSRGREVDIVAPGDKILSTYPNANYASLSGTSMATPFVSGVVALMISAGIKIGSQSNLIKRLTETAIDLGTEGFDPSYGFGLIDPVSLLGGKSKNTLEFFSSSDFSTSGINKLRAYMKEQSLPNAAGNFIYGNIKDQDSRSIGQIKITI